MTVSGLKAPLVAHIGDGNFHFTILIDPNNEKELQTAKEFNKLVVAEALKAGGTCTGEHGIGLGKMGHLQEEHGDSIFLMKLLKKTFDPSEIFNPGKFVVPQPKIDYLRQKTLITNTFTHPGQLKSHAKL